jgi:hypothetical protein
MKHTKVIELRTQLRNLKGIKSAEVNYAIFENIERADFALKAIETQEKDIEETAKAFNEERNELGKKLSEGKTRVENGVLVFDIAEEKLTEFKKAVDELREKHSESLKEYEEKRAEFIKMLNEGDSPFNPYLIKKHHIPTDIDTEKYAVLFPLIRKSTTEEQ